LKFSAAFKKMKTIRRSICLLAAILFAANLNAQTNELARVMLTPPGGANQVLAPTNLPVNAFATNTAIIPTPRTGQGASSWMKRHQAFVTQAKQGGVDLLFMGDSITDFWRRPPPRYGSNVWNQFYAPRHAANFGISGDRTEHVLWRIENGELDGIKPRVIVLMIGTNNGQTASPEQTAGAIKLIIEEFHAKLPDVKILLLGVFPRNRSNDVPAEIADPPKINAIISHYDNGSTVRYLNINDKLVGADGMVPADIMPDFLHPNEHGYQIWADAMEPLLAQMLK
jgi:lysophospholipase L1-like esterase